MLFRGPCRSTATRLFGSTMRSRTYHSVPTSAVATASTRRPFLRPFSSLNENNDKDTDDIVGETSVADSFTAFANDELLQMQNINNTSSSDSSSPSTIITTSRSNSQKTLDELPITFADVSRAEVAIRGGVVRTTCERSHFISELVGANVYFKNEFRQFTGSFKERGARNAILKLMRESSNNSNKTLKGVIAASAGNHALALAYHGQLLGVPVTVVMPTVAPLAKVDKCRVRIA